MGPSRGLDLGRRRRLPSLRPSTAGTDVSGGGTPVDAEAHAAWRREGRAVAASRTEWGRREHPGGCPERSGLWRRLQGSVGETTV